MAGNISATPRNQLLGLLADGLEKFNGWAQDPTQTQQLQGLPEMLGLLGTQRTLNRLSYGEPVTNIGKANVPMIPQDTFDAANNLIPLLGVSGKVAGKGAVATAKYVAPKAAEVAENYMLRSGLASPIFAGVNANGANLAARDTAQAMLQRGAEPAAVWKETGWGIGPDGKWRFEIPDNSASVQGGLSNVSHDRMRDINGGQWITEDKFLLNHYKTPEAAAIRQRNSMTTGRITEDTPTVSNVLSHPGLLGAYDDLGSIPVSIDHSMPIGNAALGKTPLGGDVVVMSPTDEAGSLSNLMHELQHAVQQREGFARGGSNDARGSGLTTDNLMDWAKTAYERSHETSGDPLLEELLGGSKTWDQLSDREKLGWVGQARNDAYQALGGEAEARLTESRLGMTPEQRAAQYPWEPGYFEQATGVPVNGLLNLFDSTGTQMAIDPKAQKRLVSGLLGDGDAQRYRLGDLKPAQANDAYLLGGRPVGDSVDVFASPGILEDHARQSRIVEDNFTAPEVGLYAKQAMRSDSTVLPPLKGGDYPLLRSPSMIDPVTGKQYNAEMGLKPVDDGFEAVTIIPRGLKARKKP